MSTVIAAHLFLFFLITAQILDNNDPNDNQDSNVVQQHLDEQNLNRIANNDNPSNDAIDIDNNDLEQVLLNAEKNKASEPQKENVVDIDNNINDNSIPKQTTTTRKATSSTKSLYAWVSMITPDVTTVMGARVLSQSLSKLSIHKIPYLNQLILAHILIL